MDGTTVEELGERLERAKARALAKLAELPRISDGFPNHGPDTAPDDGLEIGG